MIIESVRVSEKAKTQLVKLKAKTGISQWNILCRWAFCYSLQEPSIPPKEDIITDSNIDMTWKTFGGKEKDIYLAILKQRLANDKIKPSDENIALFFKLHLHRGISFLFQKTKTIETLTSYGL